MSATIRQLVDIATDLAIAAQKMAQGVEGLNGANVVYPDPAPGRAPDTIFVELPRALWRSCGPCACPACNGAEGFWDTLAVARNPKDGRRTDTSWTVHRPGNRTSEYVASRGGL